MNRAVIPSREEILEKPSNRNGRGASESVLAEPDEAINANGWSQGDSSAATDLIRVPIDFRELDDGSLVELVEDPEDPTRTRLAVWQDGEVRYENELSYGNQVFVALQRTGAILPHIRLPQAALPFTSVSALFDEIHRFILTSVGLLTNYGKIVASFVLSTWLVDRFPIAPYISLVGLPETGKTTLLQTLSLICRRSLLVGDITSAAFYQACTGFGPTLLIDEAGTHGNTRDLHRLLRAGTTPGMLAMRKNQTYHAFGAKVIAFSEPPDDAALNTRCIQVSMESATRTRNSVSPTDPRQIDRGMELHGKLLRFRFEHYHSIKPAEIAGADGLRPRTRDLLSVLAAPFSEDLDFCRELLQFFEWQDRAKQEPLPFAENAVLAGLFSMCHIYPIPYNVLTNDLTGLVNRMLSSGNDKRRLKPRKVGSALTVLGFLGRIRINRGWMLMLTKEGQIKIHMLVSRFGLDHMSDDWIREFPRAQEIEWTRFPDCGLCRKFKSEAQTMMEAMEDGPIR